MSIPPNYLPFPFQNKLLKRTVVEANSQVTQFCILIWHYLSQKEETMLLKSMTMKGWHPQHGNPAVHHSYLKHSQMYQFGWQILQTGIQTLTVDWPCELSAVPSVSGHWPHCTSILDFQAPIHPSCKSHAMLEKHTLSFYDRSVNKVNRLKPGNICYHLVQSLEYSSVLTKNTKTEIKRTIMLSLVFYRCETWSLTLRRNIR